jgi:hypothetical protein
LRGRLGSVSCENISSEFREESGIGYWIEGTE